MGSRLVAITLLLGLLPGAATASDWGSRDFGVTRDGGVRELAPPPRPAGDFCEGINYANDNHFDPAFMGGPLVGWNWTPASSVAIGRIEIYTGEAPGTSRVSLWSDDGGAPSRPLAPLGFSDPFPTEEPKAWYGADLTMPVDVVGGTVYWIVWDPEGDEQVSASDDPADIQPDYWGSPAGTVEGGASWSGPFSFSDRRWKARMTCVGACQDPTLAGGFAMDSSACHDGILLEWDAASFPGGGGGFYHVYRSQLDFADAVLSSPVATELMTTTWLDVDTLPGETWFYVVQAESRDFPGCGDGPSVLGSTAEIELGPVEDAADLTAPDGFVGNALRATGHTVDTVDFDWSLASLPGPGERHAIFRADDSPAGPFAELSRTPEQIWTDPDAPARPEPVHVRYYDVRLVDDCGNFSTD